MIRIVYRLVYHPLRKKGRPQFVANASDEVCCLSAGVEFRCLVNVRQAQNLWSSVPSSMTGNQNTRSSTIDHRQKHDDTTTKRPCSTLYPFNSSFTHSFESFEHFRLETHFCRLLSPLCERRTERSVYLFVCSILLLPFFGTSCKWFYGRSICRRHKLRRVWDRS